jgi:hypothetical protein
MNPRVKAVEYEGPWHLMITFTNGEIRVFDISPYLDYPVYEPLRYETFCSQAKAVNGTVAWNDIIDFDPDTLYVESRQLVEA